MLLMKNPQFLPNQADILPSEFIHWTEILTKFHKNRTKIVDFLVIAFDFPVWTFFWIWSECVFVERYTVTCSHYLLLIQRLTKIMESISMSVKYWILVNGTLLKIAIRNLH